MANILTGHDVPMMLGQLWQAKNRKATTWNHITLPWFVDWHVLVVNSVFCYPQPKYTAFSMLKSPCLMVKSTFAMVKSHFSMVQIQMIARNRERGYLHIPRLLAALEALSAKSERKNSSNGFQCLYICSVYIYIYTRIGYQIRI